MNMAVRIMEEDHEEIVLFFGKEQQPHNPENEKIDHFVDVLCCEVYAFIKALDANEILGFSEQTNQIRII